MSSPGPGLLGGDVRRGADHLRQPGRVRDRLGDAEVGDQHLGAAVGARAQQQVLRLDVAVDDPVAVQHDQPGTGLPDDVQRLLDGTADRRRSGRRRCRGRRTTSRSTACRSRSRRCRRPAPRGRRRPGAGSGPPRGSARGCRAAGPSCRPAPSPRRRSRARRRGSARRSRTRPRRSARSGAGVRGVAGGTCRVVCRAAVARRAGEERWDRVVRRPSLDELARSAAAGDAGALEDLLAAIEPRVQRIVGRMLLHPQDAEEAAQDALLAVARNIGQVRGAQPVHHLAARGRQQQRPVDVPHPEAALRRAPVRRACRPRPTRVRRASSPAAGSTCSRRSRRWAATTPSWSSRWCCATSTSSTTTRSPGCWTCRSAR